MITCLPLFVCGQIVPGFQRGSKELGIPTANYAKEVVKALPEALRIGVYYGWANVNNGEVYKMVMSVGWNPFYINKEKSMETHILHEYGQDFYGDTLKICIIGYLRPEKDFKSLEDLITAIQKDIDDAKELLTTEENLKLKDAQFFKDTTIAENVVRVAVADGEK